MISASTLENDPTNKLCNTKKEKQIRNIHPKYKKN